MTSPYDPLYPLSLCISYVLSLWTALEESVIYNQSNKNFEVKKNSGLAVYLPASPSNCFVFNHPSAFCFLYAHGTIIRTTLIVVFNQRNKIVEEIPKLTITFDILMIGCFYFIL